MKLYKTGDFYQYESDNYSVTLNAVEISIRDMEDGRIRFSLNLKGRSAKLDIQEHFQCSDVLDRNGVKYGDTYHSVLDGISNGATNKVSIDTNSAAGDAFGRQRTSEPVTLFDSKKLYGLSEGTYWNSQLGGNGTRTHIPADACIRHEVLGDGDYSIRQTKQRFNYQPGKSMLWFFTGVMNPATDTVSRVGCFHGGFVAPYDVLDGLCFEHDGTEMSVVNYKGGVARVSVPQSQWTLDKLDGTGPSGFTADWTKAQIWVMDYEWLGVGRVRYGVNIDGLTIYVHAINNANNVTSVYMRSPNQPIRYELRSTGGATTMDEICASVQSEGGFNPQGLQAVLNVDGNSIPIGAGWELVYAMRIKQSEADAGVEIKSVDVFTADNVSYQWAVLWNPIIAGTLNWTDVQGASIQEVQGDGATNNVVPIITMASGHTERSGQRSADRDFETSLKLGVNIDGTADVIALAVKTLGGTGNFKGLIGVKQLS